MHWAKSKNMGNITKNINLRALFACLLVLVAATFAQAQLDSLDAIDWSTPQGVIGGTEILYGAIVVLGGYLSRWIPFLKNITNGTYRVLAFAVAVGVGFALFGADILSLALSYAASTSIYEVILRMIIKNRNPNDGEPQPSNKGHT